MLQSISSRELRLYRQSEDPSLHAPSHPPQLLSTACFCHFQQNLGSSCSRHKGPCDWAVARLPLISHLLHQLIINIPGSYSRAMWQGKLGQPLSIRSEGFPHPSRVLGFSASLQDYSRNPSTFCTPPQFQPWAGEILPLGQVAKE